MLLNLTIQKVQLGQYSQPDLIFELNRPISICAEEKKLQDQWVSHFQFNDIATNNIAKWAFNAPAVFVLLDESSSDEAAPSFERLKKQCPELSLADNIYLFPYGRSAAQLALRQAERFFKSGTYDEIQLVVCHTAGLDTGKISAEPNKTLCDCALLVRLEPAQSGLQLVWSSYEYRIQTKPLVEITKALYRRFSTQCRQPIHQHILPLHIEPDGKNAYLHSVVELGLCSGVNTATHFSAKYFGDMGACSGLFSLCETVQRYRKGEFQGSTLHLDISAEAYCSVSFVRWVA